MASPMNSARQSARQAAAAFAFAEQLQGMSSHDVNAGTVAQYSPFDSLLVPLPSELLFESVIVSILGK